MSTSDRGYSAESVLSRLQGSVNKVRPAYEQIANQLRDRVIAGDLQPGERLPVEGRLATMFGVGRTTAREAIRLLASQGIVETRRGTRGGTFIVSPDREAICQYLETSLGLLAGSRRLGVDDLLEARMAIEAPAACLAASRHDDDRLQAMVDTVRIGSAADENMYQSEFHIAVLRATGNLMLEVMARPVFDVLRTRLLRSAAPAGFWDRVVDEHRMILEAITRRDSEGAGKTMREHLEHLSTVYREIDTASRVDGPSV